MVYLYDITIDGKRSEITARNMGAAHQKTLRVARRQAMKAKRAVEMSIHCRGSEYPPHTEMVGR